MPHVVRNLVLLATALVGWLESIRPPAAGPQPAGVVVAAGAAGIGVVLLAALDDLVGLFAGHPPVAGTSLPELAERERV